MFGIKFGIKFGKEFGKELEFDKTCNLISLI